jgi:hypothetical protein
MQPRIGIGKGQGEGQGEVDLESAREKPRTPPFPCRRCYPPPFPCRPGRGHHKPSFPYMTGRSHRPALLPYRPGTGHRPAPRRAVPLPARPVRRRSPTAAVLGLGELAAVGGGVRWGDGERRARDKRGRRGLPELQTPPPGGEGRAPSLAGGEGRAPSLLSRALTKGCAIPRLSEVSGSESVQVKRYARGDGSEFANRFHASILRPPKHPNWTYSLQIPIPQPDSMHPNTV